MLQVAFRSHLYPMGAVQVLIKITMATYHMKIYRSITATLLLVQVTYSLTGPLSSFSNRELFVLFLKQIMSIIFGLRVREYLHSPPPPHSEFES